MRLTEARQKLLAASGFSAEDAMVPDRVKACKALAADSVFEASLEGYRNSNAVIMSASAMRIKFVLTDCKSSALLFPLRYGLHLGGRHPCQSLWW